MYTLVKVDSKDRKAFAMLEASMTNSQKTAAEEERPKIVIVYLLEINFSNWASTNAIHCLETTSNEKRKRTRTILE